MTLMRSRISQLWGKRRGFIGALFLLGPLGLAACATEPASLTQSAVRSVKTRELGKVEGINVVSLQDRRGKDAVFTDIHGRPMSGVDLLGWLENSLALRGISLGSMDSDSPDTCNIDLALRRAETGIQATSKIASFVFSVRVSGSEDVETIIRGRHSSMNWASTSSETNGMLSRALDDALLDIANFCD